MWFCSYCCLKICLPGSTTEWPSPCAEFSRQIPSSISLFWSSFSFLFFNHLFDGERKAAAFENVLTYRWLLLGCTCHVVRHWAIWATSLISSLPTYGCITHCILINTELRHSMWKHTPGRDALLAIKPEIIQRLKADSDRFVHEYAYLPSSSGPHMVPCSRHSQSWPFLCWSECHPPARRQRGLRSLQE